MARSQHCRYTVVDEESGQALGSFAGREGFATIDFPMLLREFPLLAAYESSIARLEWDDYDEVRVTVRRRRDQACTLEAIPVTLVDGKGRERGRFLLGTKECPALDKLELARLLPGFDPKRLRIRKVEVTEDGGLRVVVGGPSKG